jgi:hypothetical protein
MQTTSHEVQGPEPDDTQFRYFFPGQVMLQFEHLGSQGDSELEEALKKYFTDDSYENTPAWRRQLIPPDSESILLFDGKENGGQTFSIARFQTRDGGITDEKLASLVLEITRDIKDDPPQISAGFRLKSVSPNWLMGGSPHNIGGGGPGSWPVPAADLIKGAQPQFTLTSQSPLSESSGAGVHVVILDTAPTVEDLDQALDKFGKTQRLLDSLWGQNSNRLDLRLAPASELATLDDYNPREHPYRMSDHGLFVAGIIRSIAPKASLHLIEVLNPYGVGTFERIAKGLLLALEIYKENKPLIINLSLMLVMPRSGHFDRDFPVELKDACIQEDITGSFKDIFTFLKKSGINVVAAAGNDAHGIPGAPPTAKRPAARFPAAFTSVIGVGAMPRQDTAGIRHEVASYSNLADDAPVIGYTTLGGEPGAERGILGVYIGGFPEYRGPLPLRYANIERSSIHYRRNTNGWAWWAGTSFATPIITGLLTADTGGLKGVTPSTATQRLDAFVQSSTSVGERKIVVDQILP